MAVGLARKKIITGIKCTTTPYHHYLFTCHLDDAAKFGAKSQGHVSIQKNFGPI